MEAKDFRKVNAFSNDALLVKKEYSFSEDGGAIDVYDLAQVNAPMVIEECYIKVTEAVTSAGAPTVEVGIKDGDTDALMAATVKANLTSPKVIDGAAASKRLLVAADEVISMEVKVAALTAGKIQVVMVLRPY